MIMGHIFARAIDALVSFGTLLGSIAIWMITAIVAFDVTLRYLGAPTIWALEICTYLLIAVAVAGAGDALRSDAHFAVTILPEAMPRLPRSALELLTSVAAVAFFLLFAYGALQLIEMSVNYDMKSPTVLQIPLVYPQLLLLLGAVTLILAGALRIARLIAQLRRTYRD